MTLMTLQTTSNIVPGWWERFSFLSVHVAGIHSLSARNLLFILFKVHLGCGVVSGYQKVHLLGASHLQALAAFESFTFFRGVLPLVSRGIKRCFTWFWVEWTRWLGYLTKCFKILLLRLLGEPDLVSVSSGRSLHFRQRNRTVRKNAFIYGLTVLWILLLLKGLLL